MGKSSFIETFGKHVVEQHDKRLAVLTVDPSSQSTGGVCILFEYYDLYSGKIRDFQRKHPSIFKFIKNSSFLEIQVWERFLYTKRCSNDGKENAESILNF